MLNKNQYTIIKADISHIARIKEINLQFSGEKYSDEHLNIFFNYNVPITLIQNQNNQIVGYLISFVYFDEIKIINFMVEPRYQGQGYGKALLLSVLKEVLVQDIRYAMLNVRTNNINAINLYKSVGFEIISTRENYYENCNSYLMQLKMQEAPILSIIKRLGDY